MNVSGQQRPVSPGLFVKIGLRHDNPFTEARKPPKNQASGIFFGIRSFRVVPHSVSDNSRVARRR
jgi:hypothetical protein